MHHPHTLRMSTTSPLYRARLSAGLTQNQLAEKSGVLQSTISRLERGQDSASPSTAEKLASVLGISELEILYPERYADEEAA